MCQLECPITYESPASVVGLPVVQKNADGTKSQSVQISAGRIKIHRDICKKCHQKKIQSFAGLQQSSDITTSAGKSTKPNTCTTTSAGTFVGTSQNTVKSTCKITQGSSRSIRTSMGNTSNRENRTKLDCKKLEEKIKEAMMETLQNS